MGLKPKVPAHGSSIEDVPTEDTENSASTITKSSDEENKDLSESKLCPVNTIMKDNNYSISGEVVHITLLLFAKQEICRTIKG